MSLILLCLHIVSKLAFLHSVESSFHWDIKLYSSLPLTECNKLLNWTFITLLVQNWKCSFNNGTHWIILIHFTLCIPYFLEEYLIYQIKFIVWVLLVCFILKSHRSDMKIVSSSKCSNVMGNEGSLILNLFDTFFGEVFWPSYITLHQNNRSSTAHVKEQKSTIKH